MVTVSFIDEISTCFANSRAEGSVRNDSGLLSCCRASQAMDSTDQAVQLSGATYSKPHLTLKNQVGMTGSGLFNLFPSLAKWALANPCFSTITSAVSHFKFSANRKGLHVLHHILKIEGAVESSLGLPAFVWFKL